MKINFNTIKSMFSEADGTVSLTHVIIAIVFTFVLSIGLAFALATHSNKLSMNDFDGFLNSAGTFVATSCGPLYAINRGSDYLKSKNGSNNV